MQSRSFKLSRPSSSKAGDEYIATEWVMLSWEQGDTKKILKEAGLLQETKSGIEQLRGEQTVDDQPEDQRDALINIYSIQNVLNG